MTEYEAWKADDIQVWKEIGANIDWGIISDLLCEDGWTRVELSRYVDNHHAIDIREWVAECCVGKRDNKGATWIFEDPAEATMFRLRWA